MAICPFCRVDLGEAALSGGRCTGCGRMIDTTQTLVLKIDDLPGLVAHFGSDVSPEAAEAVARTVEIQEHLKRIAELAAGKSDDAATSTPPARGTPTDADAGMTIDQSAMPKPPAAKQRSLDRSMMVTQDFGAEHPADPTIESAEMIVPLVSPAMNVTNLLPDLDNFDDLSEDQTVELGDAGPPTNRPAKVTVEHSGMTARDSHLVIKQRVVTDPKGTKTTGTKTTTAEPGTPDYQLLSVLGKGGMGVVYSARQTSIDRTVAVKMLHRETANKAGNRDKFLSEAVVTGDLDHPNIVAIYELGSNDEGALFYSMKCVQGTPWIKVIDQKSSSENLEILMKVADAVGFAHSRGVVHRDIKPENVMLGEFGEVLLMDWGMALATPLFRKSESISATTTMGGTPAYMAPEMTVGPMDHVGPASDIYLLGATLFQIITGDPPHTGTTVTECLRAAMRNEIRPTKHSGELLDIARVAMATKTRDRYGSVRAFQEAIRVALSHSESVVLTTKAREHLALAEQSGDYQAYSRALFGFQEAVALWDGNEHARGALVGAKLAYGEHALSKGDFDLAASLLDADELQHSDVLARLAVARAHRKARDRRLRNVKRLAVGLAASIFILGSLAYYQIRTQRDRAQVAEVQARDDRDKAVVSEGKATQAERLALASADQAREAARRAEDSALKEKQSAEQARQAKEAEEYEAYVARIGLAAAKIDENAFEQAAQLLADCQPHFRHWEWGRLAHLCRQSVHSFDVDKPVNSIDVSSDGKVLVAGSWDGAARLWTLPEGKLLRSIDYGAPYVNAVALSPDGKLLATGGSDRNGYLKLWDVETGELLRSFAGHSDAVVSVAFSKDGKRLLTASYDKTARLWDATTGQPLQSFVGHTWWVWSAAFSPDERSIVTAGQDRTVRVWNIATGQSSPPFTGHAGPVYAATFSPDGKSIATGGYDHQILLFDPAILRAFDFQKLSTGDAAPSQKFRAFKGHTAPVRALRFSPDGSRLLTGSDDHTVRIWDSRSGDLLKTLRGHAGWVRSCAFSPDGHWVISGSHDHTAKLWSIAGYEEVRIAQARVFQGHGDAILSACFSPDGKQIATASRDRTARLWDLSLAKAERTFEEGHQYLATNALFFPDGKKLVTSAGDNTAVVWDTASGTQILRLEPTGRSAAVTIDYDGKHILTGGDDHSANLWDAQSGQLLRSLHAHTAEVTAVACSPRGDILATGDANGSCQVWNKNDDHPLHALRGHSGRITALVFLPDGSRLLSASDDNTVGQWDVATGQEMKSSVLKHPKAVTSMAVAADGRTALTSCDDGIVRRWDLATARILSTLVDPDGALISVATNGDGRYVLAISSHDRAMRLWDLSTGQRLDAPNRGPLFSGQAGAVWSATFSPIGPQLVTVAGAGARLWDMTSGAELMSFSPNGAVASVQFSPDGKRLVTGGWDGTARVWDATTGHAELKLRSDRRVNAVAYSPDGKLLLMGTDEPQAMLCDATTGEVIRTLEGHTARVACVTFSTDGTHALTGSDDHTARLWDVSTGKSLMEFRGHRQAIACVSFARDGRKMLTGGDDKTAILWDITTGAMILTLEGHTAGITSVAIAPDGARALTASLDATAKLWDIDHSQFGSSTNGNHLDGKGKELLTLKAHTQPLTSVNFSPDGLLALTASRDGTAILWLAADWHDVAPHGERTSARSILHARP